MSDEIMSAEQAASLLGLSDSAGYRLLQQGDIPGAKVGGQWRVRRSDLSRAFDLGRARTTAQIREKTAPETWGAALSLLGDKYPDQKFVLTRCLWCPEFTPAWETSRHLTLCSFECVAELRTTFRALGWHVNSDLVLSPIYSARAGDGTELMLGPWNFEAEQMGFAPDPALEALPYARRHERGPLRELLRLEHPVLHEHADTVLVQPDPGPSEELELANTAGDD